MLNISDVTKFYRGSNVPAVENASFDVKDGEIVGFVGLNGAGKTTTIRMSAGIIKPTSGKITIDSLDIVTEKEKASYKIGWIPEFPNFEPNVKPLSLMKYYCGFYGLFGDRAESRSIELLELVGLTDALQKKLRDYSQGMKKRFAIAESLINDPGNLLFDETFNGLDPEGVKQIREMMLQFAKNGKAILLSSHILSEVEGIAHRTVIIHHGKIIKIVSRDELLTLGRIKFTIFIGNPDENTESVLKNFGTVSNNGKYYTLEDTKLSPEEGGIIVQELTKHGYQILSFTPSSETLEELFFKLVGDSK